VLLLLLLPEQARGHQCCRLQLLHTAAQQQPQLPLLL
jgi:hypothetical protein